MLQVLKKELFAGISNEFNKAQNDTARKVPRLQQEGLIMTSSEETKSRIRTRRSKYATESIESEQKLRERIEQNAYNLYQKRGGTHGHDLDDWLKAERMVWTQLEEERRSKGKPPRPKSNRSKRIKPPENREQTGENRG